MKMPFLKRLHAECDILVDIKAPLDYQLGINQKPPLKQFKYLYAAPELYYSIYIYLNYIYLYLHLIFLYSNGSRRNALMVVGFTV